REVAKRRMEFAPHEGVSGPGAGIDAGHLPIAHRRKQHGHHGDKKCRNYVTVCLLADDAKAWHRRSRLNYDDAVDDEIPESKCSPELTAVRSSAHRLGRCHSLGPFITALDPVLSGLLVIRNSTSLQVVRCAGYARPRPGQTCR